MDSTIIYLLYSNCSNESIRTSRAIFHPYKEVSPGDILIPVSSGIHFTLIQVKMSPGSNFFIVATVFVLGSQPALLRAYS